MPNKPKQKPSALNGVFSKFLSLDMFAQSQSFEVEGKTSYRTFLGSLLSLLIIIIVTPYAVKRYSIMVDYKDTRYSTSNRQNKLVNEHSDSENGITFEKAQFKMAFTVVSINLETEVTGDDPMDLHDKDTWRNYIDVGLKYRWYNSYYEDHSEDIPMHPCGNFTEEGFYEPAPLWKEATIAIYNNNMMCIDDNDKYKLYG